MYLRWDFRMVAGKLTRSKRHTYWLPMNERGYICDYEENILHYDIWGKRENYKAPTQQEL